MQQMARDVKGRHTQRLTSSDGIQLCSCGMLLMTPCHAQLVELLLMRPPRSLGGGCFDGGSEERETSS
jgi:hypothetical protein